MGWAFFRLRILALLLSRLFVSNKSKSVECYKRPLATFMAACQAVGNGLLMALGQGAWGCFLMVLRSFNWLGNNQCSAFLRLALMRAA